MAPSNNKQSLKDKARENPTQIGDPVSLKAETSDTEPTEKDRGAKGSSNKNVSQLQSDPVYGQPVAKEEQQQQGSGSSKDGKTLKQKAEANPTMLGDPVSLKAETSDTEVTEDDRGALGTGKGKKRESKI